MEYQLTKEDERFLEKMESEENEMLLKYYDLKKSDANCPKNPYLLQPEKLQLTSYQVLSATSVKLNIGYIKSWSGYVSSTVRMNYNRYIIGTLCCEDVEYVKEVDYNKKGSITIPFFSKSKILNLPIQHDYNIKIKCKCIRVIDINIYAKDAEGNLILDEVFREDLRESLEKNNNTIDNV